MLRIQRHADDDTGRVTFRLEGRLGSRELDLLLGSIAPELGRRAVDLDLARLRFLDDPGARRLSDLAARGVGLLGATGYVHALLASLKEER